MKAMLMRLLSITLAMMLCSLATANAGVTPPTKNVTVHLFEWKWSDIEKECAYLQDKGYSAVQVSPPVVHRIVEDAYFDANGRIDHPWWHRYQPVSYELSESRSGTVDEFKNMVRSCWQDHGVKIYVDVIINHMAEGEDVASDGSYYRFPDFKLFDATAKQPAEFFSSNDFHPDCGIQDYGNRWQVHNCRTSNLPDLKTESEHVRRMASRYLNQFIDMGVAGFRLDTAKHVPVEDLKVIFSAVQDLKSDDGWFAQGRRPFVYQEVIGGKGPNEAIRVEEHMFSLHGENMQITEFDYGRELGKKFRSDGDGPISHFLKYNFPVASSGWGLVDSAFALVFTDNHDNQRGHGSGYYDATHDNAIGGILTHFYDGDHDGQSSEYNLANVFMLAWPYGSPRIMSSYHWERDVVYGWNDGSMKNYDRNDWMGPPSVNGRTQDVDCANNSDSRWVCEHRWTSIAGMVGFNNFTQDAWAIGHGWHNDNNQIAFARVANGGRSRGFVVINREYQPLAKRLQTGLPAGRYCDVAVSDYSFNQKRCHGAFIEVDSAGYADFKVPAMTASAIHIGARQ